MSEVPPQYNSQTVIESAEAKLQEEGINAAQTVFQSALLDWVDDVTMGDMGENMDAIRGEIVNLWLAYANLNRKSNLVSPYIACGFLCFVCMFVILYVDKRHRQIVWGILLALFYCLPLAN